jgi:hypothetical protein
VGHEIKEFVLQGFDIAAGEGVFVQPPSDNVGHSVREGRQRRVAFVLQILAYQSSM